MPIRFTPLFVRYFSCLALLLAAAWAPTTLQAQHRVVTGYVTDAETAAPIVSVSVRAQDAGVITFTDHYGHYRLEADKPFGPLYFETVGYDPVKIKPGKDTMQALDITMRPANVRIQEVTIKPQKYSNKNNPTVELIQLVIEHRDQNRVENLQTFQEEQYEKVVFGMGKVSRHITNHFLLKGIRFIWENKDSSKMDGVPIVPLFVQENLLNYYSRSDPKLQKKLVHSIKSVRFSEDLDDEGTDASIRYLFQGVDIYENNVTMFTNQFASPISNNAPLLYRYYPVDTVVQNGKKVVRLEFYPRNKTDLLLQGEMSVVLDSTYPVSHVRFIINPHANLNWVNWAWVEQTFRPTPEGKYILATEDYRTYFGMFKKMPTGMFGQRYVEHRNYQINAPLPADTLIDKPGKIVVLPGADKSKENAFWTSVRAPITPQDSMGYINMDSVLHSPWYRRLVRFSRLMSGGYTNVSPYVDLGPLPNIYAFNGIEGGRWLLSARTTPKLSKRFQITGRAQYGTRDERWKYGLGATVAMPGSAFNKFPQHYVRFEYSEDLRIPGEGQFQNNFLGTSVVHGSNDKLMYVASYKLQYKREYRSNFSFTTGVERDRLEPAGNFRFLPADTLLPEVDAIRAARVFVQLRYAPGEVFMQGVNGTRSTVATRFTGQLRLAHAIQGFLGGDYRYDEAALVIQNFINTPPLGYNRSSLEAGAIFGTVPYPLLSIHRANQSYIFQENAFNLMNFMEFMSDRYVALNFNHFFNGYFLNKVPLVKQLKLREVVGFKMVYGTVSPRNRPSAENGGLFAFPTYPDGRAVTYTLNRGPYMEASFGVSNIFKVLRIDFVYRLNYLDHPEVQHFGVLGKIQIDF